MVRSLELPRSGRASSSGASALFPEAALPASCGGVLLVGKRMSRIWAVHAALAERGCAAVRICAEAAAAATVAAEAAPAVVAVDAADPALSGAAEAIMAQLPEVTVVGLWFAAGAGGRGRRALRWLAADGIAPEELADRLLAEAAMAADRRRMLATLAQSGTLPTLAEMRDMLIGEALRRHPGNLSAAARLLGLSRQAMHVRVRTPRPSSETSS